MRGTRPENALAIMQSQRCACVCDSVRDLVTDESEALELHGLSPGLEVAEEEVLRLLGRLESHLGPAAPTEPDHVQRVHLVMARQLLDVAAEMTSGVRARCVECVRCVRWCVCGGSGAPNEETDAGGKAVHDDERAASPRGEGADLLTVAHVHHLLLVPSLANARCSPPTREGSRLATL